MLPERLFYYRGESRTRPQTVLRNVYLLAAFYVWASGVIFAVETSYPLPVAAYLLSVWIAPVAFYWTPLFQHEVVDRLLVASPLEAALPVRFFGFLILIVPIAGTLFLVAAGIGYVISRRRGTVHEMHRAMDAIRERESELLDEIAALDVTTDQEDALEYLHEVVLELHETRIHPTDFAYRKQALADIETNLEAIREVA